MMLCLWTEDQVVGSEKKLYSSPKLPARLWDPPRLISSAYLELLLQR